MLTRQGYLPWILPCGFVEGGVAGLPVGLQMIGAAFDEVLKILIAIDILI